ncbi:MAG: GlcG protein [Polaromonas sp.]|nr:GlcG protein [Polaromonas sp.]
MTLLTLDIANAIISAALTRAQELGYRPMAVVVLDEAGHVKASQRADGASMFRIDIAAAKAWGAVAMGVSSRQLGERAAGNPNFFVSLAATSQGKFLPQAGAVLIKSADGAIVGAVGASGGTGDEDEAVCIHGVESTGLRVG